MSIQVNAITNTTYQNNQNIRSVNLNYKPWVDNSMVNAFYNCNSLQNVSSINENVTNMMGTFYKCANLVNAPIIPNSVTYMTDTFLGCSNLVNAPKIPNSVTGMYKTFSDCHNLVNAPNIPNSITYMWGTFDSCYNLVNAPKIPNSVTDMFATFAHCTNLVNAPEIPDSVTNMFWTFIECNHLTGNIYIHSKNIIQISSENIATFSGTTLNKNVYIPFKYENGARTKTYNTFTSGGYSTTVRKDGVLLFDIDNPEPVVNEYEYTILSSGKVDLTKYIGSGGAIVTPTIIG